MGKETGKPLTNAQRKLLQTSGVVDTSKWRYLKQVITSESGHVTRNNDKTIYAVFVHAETRETKMVPMMR